MEKEEKRKAIVYVFDTETLLAFGEYETLDDEELTPLFEEMLITRDKMGAQDIIIINSASENRLSDPRSEVPEVSNKAMIKSWYSMAKMRKLEDDTHKIILGRCFYKEGFATFAEPKKPSEGDLFVGHSIDGRPIQDRLLEYIDVLAMNYDIKELIVVCDWYGQIDPLIDTPLYEEIPVTQYTDLALPPLEYERISMIDSFGNIEIGIDDDATIESITKCAKLHNENMTDIMDARRELQHQKEFLLRERNPKHE